MNRLSSQPHVLFAYGTLLFPEILSVLLGRVPDSAPATVPGWRVAALPARVYPVLVPADGGTARGKLITGLTPGEWQVLDAFEDPLYDLRRVTLATGRAAWAYATDDASRALPVPWDIPAFTAQLPAYVTRCTAWRAGYAP